MQDQLAAVEVLLAEGLRVGVFPLPGAAEESQVAFQLREACRLQAGHPLEDFPWLAAHLRVEFQLVGHLRAVCQPEESWQAAQSLGQNFRREAYLPAEYPPAALLAVSQ